MHQDSLAGAQTTISDPIRAGSSGYCDLCHVHMPPEKHDRSLGRVGHTLLWVITNHVALVLQPSPGGANPRSGNQSSVERFIALKRVPEMAQSLSLVSSPNLVICVCSCGCAQAVELVRVCVDLVICFAKQAKILSWIWSLSMPMGRCHVGPSCQKG